MIDILNLALYTTLNLIETDHDYHITARPIYQPLRCPHCGSDNFKKHGTREPEFMDTPMHGKRVGVKIVRQRYYCRDCHRTFADQLFDVDETRLMTRRLIRFIRQMCFKTTNTAVAWMVGVDESTIRSLFRQYMIELAAEYKVETPRWLGLDEVHLLDKPRGVVTHVEKKTLVDILKNRKKDAVKKYLFSLTEREKIECVTMDMWNPYREAVRDVPPNAQIIADKFHVLQLVSKCLDKARKEIGGQTPPEKRRELMRSRFLLLKRPEDLNPMETLSLEAWLENALLLKTAYDLKEAFYDIYEARTMQEAETLFAKWKDQFTPDGGVWYKDLLTAAQNWSTEIFAYFEQRITNAFTDSVNGRIKEKNRLGRGYSFEVIRARILYGQFEEDIPKYGKEYRQSVRDHPWVTRDTQTPYSYKIHPFPGLSIATFVQLLIDSNLKLPENH